MKAIIHWPCWYVLTHWGRVTHLCVSKLTSIASDNGLSPGRRQAIIWNNAGILLIGPLGTNFSEILIEIHIFSLKKIRLKMSSAKCCSFRLGLNVLIFSAVTAPIFFTSPARMLSTTNMYDRQVLYYWSFGWQCSNFKVVNGNCKVRILLTDIQYKITK